MVVCGVSGSPSVGSRQFMITSIGKKTLASSVHWASTSRVHSSFVMSCFHSFSVSLLTSGLV